MLAFGGSHSAVFPHLFPHWASLLIAAAIRRPMKLSVAWHLHAADVSRARRCWCNCSSRTSRCQESCPGPSQVDFMFTIPRTTLDDVRSPTAQEWQRWSLMPRLPLWQAVALLSEIEPTSLPAEGLWRFASPGTPASIFRDRFKVAVEHHFDRLLDCESSIRGFYTDLRVRTGDFVAWVSQMGWQVPDALARWSGRSEAAATAVGAEAPAVDVEPCTPQPVGSERLRALEEGEALRRAATREKAQQASAVRWSPLAAHKAEAIRLARSRSFRSRRQAAEYARENVPKDMAGKLFYSVETVDKWLKEAGWKRPAE